MGIEKLIKKAEEDKKSISKSFRLRSNAADCLENISETLGVSQNEIVNTIIEDTYDNLNIFKKIKLFFENSKTYQTIKLRKKLKDKHIIMFEIKKGERFFLCTWNIYELRND